MSNTVPGAPLPVVTARPALPEEDRIVAALAHVGLFFGFWLIAPVVVYVMKRKQSAHASFHAAQAFVLWALHIPFSLFAAIGGIVLSVVLASMAEAGARGGHGHGEIFAGLGVLGFLGCLGIPTLAFFAVSIVAAVRAYNGTTWSIPLVGGIAKKLMRLDKEALQLEG